MLARIVEALARSMAVLGGLVLSGLIVMTCLSILGRATGGWFPDAWGIGPIKGDFELVEAGMAFVIFAFLPYTQLTGGHASVDVFTGLLGPRPNRWLTAAWAILFAVVMALIAWQLWQGTLDKRRFGETSFLIQFPVWWAYAAALSGAVVAALTAVYVAAVRVAELVTGQPILTGEGAEP